MQREAFIFDLDGTLLDTQADLVHITNLTMDAFGYPQHSSERIVSFVGDGARELIRRAIPAGATEQHIDEVFEHWRSLYPQFGHAKTVPYPGIADMLDALRDAGMVLGVVSNKVDEAAQAVIAKHLPGYFAVVHGECPEYPRKPDPTALRRTIEELGTTPERSVYVGDSPGDVQVAQAVGAFAVGVSWGYRSAQAISAQNPDALIDHPSQLLAFL